MNNAKSKVILALALALVTTPAEARSLYVEAGRLLDVESGAVATGQCLLTQDERIARIEPCGATPAGAERVDWSGYTVLPGLIDLHTHLADAGQDADVALPLKTSPQATALIGAQNARTTLMAGFTTHFGVRYTRSPVMSQDNAAGFSAAQGPFG